MRLRGSGQSLAIVLAALTLSGGQTAGHQSADIRIDPATRYQTMTGWEVAVLSTVQDYISDLPAFAELLPLAANDLGITRIQLSVNPGLERPPGYAARYISGELRESVFIEDHLHTAINDNADPQVADLSRFEFGVLDWNLDNLVVPFRKLVEARGDRLAINLHYVDYSPSPFEHYQNPEEYGEFMLVVFNHMKARYGFVPDGIDVLNEPDKAGWNGGQMGRVMVAAARRLAAAGYTPWFTVPSTMDRGRTIEYLDQILRVSGARPLIKEIGYHCYADSGSRSRERIYQRAIELGARTLMNECWSSDSFVPELHADLKVAGNSTYQQGVFNAPNDGYYLIERGRVRMNGKTGLMRQYYRYIRPGDVRVGATSTNIALDPIAFVQPSGGAVAVVRAETGGVFTMTGLPAGAYSIRYTTRGEYDKALPDVTIGAGESLTARIPEWGVLTVFPKAR